MSGNELLSFVSTHDGLKPLFYGDATFRNAVYHAVDQKMSREEMLIAAIMVGYAVKDQIAESYTKFMQMDCRPILLAKVDA